MSFYCAHCGKHHEELPAIACIAPDFYVALSEEQKTSIAQLAGDLCIIDYGSQVDRFIRAVIAIPILGTDDTLDFGVWVSASKNSFDHYSKNFYNNIEGTSYFGYISNQLPGFPDTLYLKTDIICQIEGNRPYLRPHRDQMEHLFVKAFYEGVSPEFASDLVHLVIGHQ